MTPRTQIPFTFRQLEVFNTVARSDTIADAAVELFSGQVRRSGVSAFR